MRVTSIRFDYVNPPRNGVCARASVTFDNCFIVHNIGVLQGKKGMCITYPNTGVAEEQDGVNRYVDIAHPINNSFSKEISDQVLKEYNDIVSKMSDK